MKRFHADSEYVRRRESLIPEAELIANRECGAVPADKDRWSRCFLQTMDRLWQEKGASIT